MICSLAMDAPPSEPAPLAASAGIRRRRVPAEPLQRWVDLMELIEGLSPRWPARRRRVTGTDFRL